MTQSNIIRTCSSHIPLGTDNLPAILQGTASNVTENNSHLSIMLSCCSVVLGAGRQTKIYWPQQCWKVSDSKLPQHSRSAFWKDLRIFVECLLSVKLEGKLTQVLISDNKSIIWISILKILKMKVEIPHPPVIKSTKQKSLLADMFEKLCDSYDLAAVIDLGS